MKTCKKCGRVLPLSGFYIHKAMADGHLNFCKDCVKTRVGQYREQNIETIRAYDRVRGKTEERLKAVRVRSHNDVRIRESQRRSNQRYYRKMKELGLYAANRSRKNYPEKAKARGRISNAKVRGKIQPEACAVCGEPKSEGHHSDYSNPLAVIWLCRKHHGEVHRKNLDEITIPFLREIAEKMISGTTS